MQRLDVHPLHLEIELRDDRAVGLERRRRRRSTLSSSAARTAVARTAAITSATTGSGTELAASSTRYERAKLAS
jgi:hypothetical protein